MEKIIVYPESVRGYGNIMMEHSVEDYTLVGSSILESTDTVMGAETTVYTLDVEDSSISIVLSSSVGSCYLGDTVTLSATVTDDSVAVEGGTVTFKLNTTTLGTDETDSNGEASYTYTTASVGSLNFTAYYESHNSNTVSVVCSHDYSIAFDSSSYTTSDGNVTAYVTLLDNSNPVSGASISLTGTGSTLSATTNSSGVATFNLTGISADCTITATYENVSDTATITVQTGPLFYDACSTDNTSQYTECSDYWELTSNPTFNITFDTDHYVISHSTGDFMGVCLPNLTTSVDNYVFTADVLATGTNTDYGAGLGMIKKQNVGTGQGMVQPNSASSNRKHTYLHNVNNSNGRVVSQAVTTGYVVGDYHTHRLTKQGTSILYEILHNGTVIFTKSNTCADAIATETVPCLCIGRWETGAKFKNIKVESL